MWQSLISSDCIVDGAATLNCFPIIVSNVIYWLLVLAGITAVAMVVFSGFKFVTSGGDPKQAEGARKTLTFAILGLVLVLMSFMILPLIAKTTGVKERCLTRFGFSQCVPADISKPCSNSHNDGFCTNERHECLPTEVSRGVTQWMCQYRCGVQKGWCPGGKTCKSVYSGGGRPDWQCK